MYLKGVIVSLMLQGLHVFSVIVMSGWSHMSHQRYCSWYNALMLIDPLELEVFQMELTHIGGGVDLLTIEYF